MGMSIKQGSKVRFTAAALQASPGLQQNLALIKEGGTVSALRDGHARVEFRKFTADVPLQELEVIPDAGKV